MRENAPDRGHITEPSLDAADSYHRYSLDMQLLADAGLTAYRFSIEWARIEPEPGLVSRAQLLHYRRMVETARSLGLEPLVTLHHFTNPRWFADLGGWRAPDAVQRFRSYVEAALPVVEGVRYVCTFNEPNMTAVLASEGAGESFQAGMLPPGDPQVSDTLAEAHAACREVLRGAGHAVGWTVANQAFQAAPGAEQAMADYAASREDYFLDVAREDDWLGVQAYTRTVIGVDGQPVPAPKDVERTLTDWEYYPAALGEAVRHAAERVPGVPLLITENGIATADDERRIAYTAAALQGLQAAIDDGADVRGYLHWSALDNYEWGSYRPTFGLIGWDRQTFERQPKPSLAWLGQRAREYAENGRIGPPN